MERLVLTVSEMAEALDVSLPFAYQLCHRADFPAVKLGRKIVIPKDQLDQWLETQSRIAG